MKKRVKSLHCTHLQQSSFIRMVLSLAYKYPRLRRAPKETIWNFNLIQDYNNFLHRLHIHSHDALLFPATFCTQPTMRIAHYLSEVKVNGKLMANTQKKNHVCVHLLLWMLTWKKLLTKLAVMRTDDRKRWMKRRKKNAQNIVTIHEH